MMRSRSKIITCCAVFTAAGLIIGYIENFLVIPVHVPGIRLGLANMTSILAMYMFGPTYAAAVLFLRVVLSALLFGSPISFAYSMAGAAVSLAGMIILSKLGFSIYGVSVGGAVLHNMAQITVAWFLVGNIYVLTYIPVLIPAGVGAGLLTGFLSSVLMTRLKRIFIIEREDGV